MPYSVALNQPYFAPDDDGGLGQWAEIAMGLTQVAMNVGGSLLTAKINTDAIQKQIAAQTQSAKELVAFKAQQEMAVAQGTPITASPLFLPVIGGIGALFLYMAYKGKR